MATHYNSSSRGPVEIAAMRYEHALNARDKLMRECAPELGGKIDARASLTRSTPTSPESRRP
jgi:hypothetical protein